MPDLNTYRKQHLPSGSHRRMLSDVRKAMEPRHTSAQSWYAELYGRAHCEAVELAVHRLLEDQRLSLSEYEILAVLSAAWLYCAPYVDPQAQPDDYPKLLSTQGPRAEAIAQEVLAKLKLPDEVGRAVETMCRYHGELGGVPEAQRRSQDIQTWLLMAVLAVADAVHGENTGPDDAVHVHRHEGARFHWLKSHLTDRWEIDIKPDAPTRLKIWLRPTDLGKDRVDSLERLVLGAFRSRIYAAEAVLRAHAKPGYDALVETDAGARLQPGDSVVRVIDTVILYDTGSSGALAESSAKTILEICRDRTHAPPVAKQQIERHLHHVLKPISDDRSCHVMLGDLLRRVDTLLEKPRWRELLTTELTEFLEERAASLSQLRKNARPVFVDRAGILLFGYSATVLDALDGIVESAAQGDSQAKSTLSETHFYVCNCAVKTSIGADGHIVYSDGVQYAKAVANKGIKHVHLVPDAAAGTLARRKLVQKVIFGANGVDLDPNPVDSRSPRFGHTAGHSTIIAVAAAYRLPVYVFADHWKFGEIPGEDRRDRPYAWLPQQTVDDLKFASVWLMNPREDVEELNPSKGERLYYLVTDVGMFPASQIPEWILDRCRGLKPWPKLR